MAEKKRPMSSTVGLTRVLKYSAVKDKNINFVRNDTSQEAVRARSLAGLPEPLKRRSRPTTAVQQVYQTVTSKIAN